MTKTQALTLAPALTPARTQPPTVIEIISEMARHGVTKENAEALTTLCKLKNEEEDRKNKGTFARSFLALQKILKQFKAIKEVKTKDGNGVKYRTMDFPEIDEQLKPLVLEYGFTYSFSEAPRQTGFVGETCIVMHEDGHERRNDFYMREGVRLPKSDGADPKDDLAIHGYARRGALCDAFSIVLDRSGDDARNAGHPIDPEQAEELKRLVGATGTMEPSFFKYAGGKHPVKDYSEIMSNRYEELHEYLSKRERVQKQKAQ